jgi:hypothetical protein
MTTKNLEQDPEYLALVNEALDAADEGLRLGKAMIGREGYIFVSAPHAITPTHVDHEQSPPPDPWHEGGHCRGFSEP